MAFLETPLSPLIFLFRLILEAGHGMTGSYGVAIVLLNVVVAMATYPLYRYTRSLEESEKGRYTGMAEKVAGVKAALKGEAQFNAIEKIYQEYNYHPIKSLKSVAGFGIQLPFLLSGLLLLTHYPPLEGQGFLFLADLGKPDGLLIVSGYTLNLMPFLMSGISFFEAAVKKGMTQPERMKFYFISGGIFFLIYAFPSAVVLYWTCSNVISLSRTLLALRG